MGYLPLNTHHNPEFHRDKRRWFVPILLSHHLTPILHSLTSSPTDCVSLKPNSTTILLQNLRCNGTHGISVGSLGQYPTQVDYVENVLVRNISMTASSEGARIKVWPSAYAEKSSALTGGGGGGLVRNVTYDGMWLDNVDYGLTVTQCYGQDNETACFENPVGFAFPPSSSPLTLPPFVQASQEVKEAKAKPPLPPTVQTQNPRYNIPQHPRAKQPRLRPPSRPPSLLRSRHLLQHRSRERGYQEHQRLQPGDV